MDNSDSPFANFKVKSSNGKEDANDKSDEIRWKRPLRPYEEKGDPERRIEFSGEFVGDAKVEKSN